MNLQMYHSPALHYVCILCIKFQVTVCRNLLNKSATHIYFQCDQTKNYSIKAAPAQVAATTKQKPKNHCLQLQC